MDQLPDHILENLARDKDYYSLDRKENILRCREDKEYLGEVILANENLIWHSVHKYIGNPDAIVKANSTHLDKDDILQLGRLGLLKSIYAFDVDRGVKFSSFAVTAIVREIRCYIRDNGSTVRLTRTAKNLLNRILAVEYDLGYMPSVEDLAILLDEDEEKIVKALTIGQGVLYLDERSKDKAGSLTSFTWKDIISSGDNVEEDALDNLFTESVFELIQDRLSDLEARVLRHRLDGYNQTQTAAMENISQIRVSRIMKKIAKIVKEMQKEGKVV